MDFSSISDEIYSIYSTLSEISSPIHDEDIAKNIEAVERSADIARKAFSGSWLGYHSRVYYDDLQPPPPGANFSAEWGFQDSYMIRGTTGKWREYNFDDIRSVIFARAGDPDFSSLEITSRVADEAFETAKFELVSLLKSEKSLRDDEVIQTVLKRVEKIFCVSKSDFVKAARPSGKFMTRDTLAATQGSQIPPHIDVAAEIIALKAPFVSTEQLAKECKKSASHIKRLSKGESQRRSGNRVFIGHGRSPVWRELKDFVQGRLSLDWDEFNRIPVAGITNIARLNDMLDAASFALLVLTAEDETRDGTSQARMNVVHEAGLFQGRLGFNRAIILLEDGCEQFSNIEGLSQIRFPKGNMESVFEQVRAVLEREQII